MYEVYPPYNLLWNYGGYGHSCIHSLSVKDLCSGAWDVQGGEKY